MISHTSSFIDASHANFSWRRWLTALPPALLITAGLILGMERLIASKAVELPPITEHRMPDIVMPERETEVIIDNRPEPPERVEPVPETPPPQIDIEAGPRNLVAPEVPRDPITPSITGFNSDQPVPMLMTSPDYPHRALTRGIEGYVELIFDVTATGTTVNIQVIAADPEGLFDRAAIRAIQNWKYTPVSQNGNAKAYQGVRQRLVFELDSGKT